MDRSIKEPCSPSSPSHRDEIWESALALEAQDDRPDCVFPELSPQIQFVKADRGKGTSFINSGAVDTFQQSHESNEVGGDALTWRRRVLKKLGPPTGKWRKVGLCNH
ncbi:hypothetical protein FQN60_016573 [Etheostoma spectabile]|uniref:Uncharacterized protein n=1 Tax=Etheostoma spectabile TaxID=54343 RepID=A0A5J5D817_9PERO|nr:hypothetical protein FQN60_016573 [Etheostoma spectabile]